MRHGTVAALAPQQAAEKCSVLVAVLDAARAAVVLEHRLHAIVEEMGEAMLRTAYSQILNSSRDFSIALTDRQAMEELLLRLATA
ncbi:MAG TPA: hydantoinase B/oxoprolinase family protein, partial [Phycisphaerales bacterium]|nr:hydantoinase B/oxoprolinase family protein [Phycisphaerales bacterium]